MLKNIGFNTSIKLLKIAMLFSQENKTKFTSVITSSNNSYISIFWEILNEKEGTIYDILISTDSICFKEIHQEEGKKYDIKNKYYSHVLYPRRSNLFFIKIRRTGPNGMVSYSDVSVCDFIKYQLVYTSNYVVSIEPPLLKTYPLGL